MAAVLPMGTSKPTLVVACSCQEGECETARNFGNFGIDGDRQERCARFVARTKTVVAKVCKHCPSSNAEIKISCHADGVCLSKIDCEREAMLKRRRY